MATETQLTSIYRLEFCKKQKDWCVGRQTKSISDLQRVMKTPGDKNKNCKSPYSNQHSLPRRRENTNRRSPATANGALDTVRSDIGLKPVISNTTNRKTLNRTYSLEYLCDLVDTEPVLPEYAASLTATSSVLNNAFFTSWRGDGASPGSPKREDDLLPPLESEASFMLGAANAHHSSELELRRPEAMTVDSHVKSRSIPDDPEPIPCEEPIQDLSDWAEDELADISMMSYNDMMQIVLMEHAAVKKHARRYQHLLTVLANREPSTPGVVDSNLMSLPPPHQCIPNLPHFTQITSLSPIMPPFLPPTYLPQIVEQTSDPMIPVYPSHMESVEDCYGGYSGPAMSRGRGRALRAQQLVAIGAGRPYRV